MLNKKSVDDINVKGQKVLVRCDFNVPLQDGKITDENRLVAALPTIKKLIADGGKVILCSHLGKPKGEPKPELSLAPVAERLSELLGQESRPCFSGRCICKRCIWYGPQGALLQCRCDGLCGYGSGWISDAERDRFPRKCSEQSREAICGYSRRGKGFLQNFCHQQPA